MKRAILYGIVAAFFFFTPSANGQTFELTCPAGSFSVNSLQSFDQSTGKFRQNYCIDANGNVFENIGTVAPTRIGAEIYPSGLKTGALSNADCGTLILAAIALLPANGGTLKINQSCGTGTSSVPWTAISTSLNFLTLDFVESGNYFIGGITMTGIGSGVRGLPCASTVGGLQCSVTLSEGNGANLPRMIFFNGGGYQFLQNVALDGRNSTNQTGGVILEAFNAPRINVDHASFQNAVTHGRWIHSTANAGCCSKFIMSMSLNNNGDAILIQDTSDIYLSLDENESQGINPIVNTQNAATGGCTANCVTWVSGPKWSTDASLIGTAVRLNNTSGLFFISSIQSITVLTLTSAPGTQTGVQFNNGNAVENRNGGGMRAVGGEISGSTLSRGIDGLLAYCGGGASNGVIIVSGVALGNNNQDDIGFYGSDPAAPATQCMFGNVVTGNKFAGGAVRTPDNTWSNVFVQDGGQHVIDANVYTTNNSPNRAKYAIQLTETSPGRAALNHIGGLINTGYGAAGSPWIDSNQSKSSISLGDQTEATSSLQGFTFSPSMCMAFTPSAVQTCLTPAGVATNLAMPNLSGTAPGPIFSSNGTNQGGIPHLVQDTATLAAGTVTITFTGAAVFTNATSYSCVADDDTAIAATRVLQNSGSSITITGTGADVVRYICTGN